MMMIVAQERAKEVQRRKAQRLECAMLFHLVRQRMTTPESVVLLSRYSLAARRVMMIVAQEQAEEMRRRKAQRLEVRAQQAHAALEHSRLRQLRARRLSGLKVGTDAEPLAALIMQYSSLFRLCNAGGEGKAPDGLWDGV